MKRPKKDAPPNGKLGGAESTAPECNTEQHQHVAQALDALESIVEGLVMVELSKRPLRWDDMFERDKLALILDAAIKKVEALLNNKVGLEELLKTEVGALKEASDELPQPIHAIAAKKLTAAVGHAPLEEKGS